MGRSLGGVTAFVLDLSCGCSGIEPACEGVCHCQSFVHQTNTAPFAGQSDTCGAGRAQLNPSVMPGRATVFFSQSSITIHVFYWNPTQQKCWYCDDSFRSRGRPKALCAVRLGVRGAKRCAGQLGGRARVQRGGDLSRTYVLGAAIRWFINGSFSKILTQSREWGSLAREKSRRRLRTRSRGADKGG